MGPTAELAEFMSHTPTNSLPDWLFHESKRTFINFLAVSLSAASQPPAVTMVSWIRRAGGSKQATIIQCGQRSSLYNAALANGYLCHLQDYDDTHLPTVLHPSAPTWPAVLAAAEHTGATGQDTLAAFGLGAELACRVAMSVHPWHYEAGWHITGTVGGFGAAAGAGRLLRLDSRQMAHALGCAATQAGGLREVFGSMAKALHAGRAAANGVQAAQLAAEGFTATDVALEGRRGFWAVLSSRGHNEAALLQHLGERWELRRNGIKPYANGVVAHPIQDAVIDLRNKHHLLADQVLRIEAIVNPLVVELMDNPEPRTGLEAKFSFQHCSAVALVDGAGHEAQFTNARVADGIISRLRAKVSAQTDPAMAEDAAGVTITLNDGARLVTRVQHATGSTANPMSDSSLEDKFRALAGPVMGTRRAERLLAACWELERARDVSEIVAGARFVRRSTTVHRASRPKETSGG